MSEIPQDILDVTNKLVNDYVNPDVPRPDYRPTLRKMVAAALLAERERHQWQPIDTAPKDGTIIDLCTTSGVVCLNEWWIEEDGESFWSCDFDDKFLSHWRPVMPLPTPPIQVSEQ